MKQRIIGAVVGVTYLALGLGAVVAVMMGAKLFADAFGGNALALLFLACWAAAMGAILQPRLPWCRTRPPEAEGSE